MSDTSTRTPAQAAQKSETPKAGPPARRKSRKLRLFIILFVVAIVALVALAPTIASLPAVTHYALSFANDRLAGRMSVKSMALSWFGSTQIDGLSVSDPDHHDVISVSRIVCNNGIWNLARNWETFGDVVIDSPKVELIFTKDNDLTLAQAFASRTPSPGTSSSSPLPQPRGKLVIKNGTIRVVQANGDAFEVSDFEGQFKVNTLADLVGQIAAALTGGGRLSGDVSLQDLVRDGQLRPRQAKGTVKLATDGLVKIGPLADIVARQQGLDGAARLKLDASFDAGTIRAVLDAAVEKLQTRERAAAKAAPLDLALNGQLDVVGDKLTANTKLSGQPGTATADLTYRITEKPPQIDTEQLVSAILTGRSIDLPDFTLNAAADIDLATLEQAVPGLLIMGEGRQITSGKLSIEKVVITGGSSAAAQGNVQVRDIAATNEGKTVRLEPMTLAFDAGLVPDTGLQVREADLKTCFANIKGSGAATNLKATYDANLTRLKQELSQIVDMSGYDLAGDITGSIALNRASSDRVDVTMKTTGNAIKYTTKDGTLDLPKASFTETGFITLKNNAVQTFVADKVQADINGELVASATSKFDLVTNGFDTDIDLQHADLGALGRRLAPLGLKDLARYAGNIVAKARASRASAKSPIFTTGNLTAENLAVDGKTLGDRNIAAEWSGVQVATDGGLKVDSAKLESAFARLNAKAIRYEKSSPFLLTGSVDVSADLQRTTQAISPFVDMSGCQLAGDMTSSIELARASDDRVNVTMQTTGNAIRYTTKDGTVETKRVSLSQSGYLKLEKNQAQSFIAEKVQADIDGELLATATGKFDLVKQGFDTEIDLQRADLGALGRRLAPLGLQDLARYAGNIVAKARASRASATAAIDTSGNLTAQNLAVDGKPLADRNITAQWSGVQIAQNGGLSVASAKLESAFAKLAASGVRFENSTPVVLTGNIDVNADLTRTFQAIAPLADMKKPPEIAGQLAWSARCGASGGAISFDGKGGIDQLEFGAGQNRVRAGKVDIDCDAKLDPKTDRIDVNSARIASQFLNVNAKGTIEQFRKECSLNLSGNYQAMWDTITVLIHELAPDTRKNVILTGRSVSDFKLTGPISAPNIDPPFRTANGGAGVGWAKASLYGVDMGAANLAPTLRDGEIVLPDTAIPAAGGRVNLRGQVDLKPKEPILKIPGKLNALETVVITKELGEQLLSRINPVFSQMARVEGNVSFSTQDILLPLGDSLNKGGSGRGRLDLKNMKIQPGGILGDALALGGLSKSDLYAVTISSVDFLIKNGRIFYDNLTMTFPGGFDLKFLGSVGFDGTLDLVMSIPVRPALLTTLGVKLPGTEFVDRLTGMRINIPLSGTRENPKLDFSKVDKAELLKGLVPETPGKAIDSVLKTLQDAGSSKDKPAAAPKEAPAQNAPPQQEPPKQSPPDQPPPKEKQKPLLPRLLPKKKK